MDVLITLTPFTPPTPPSQGGEKTAKTRGFIPPYEIVPLLSGVVARGSILSPSSVSLADGPDGQEMKETPSLDPLDSHPQYAGRKGS